MQRTSSNNMSDLGKDFILAAGEQQHSLLRNYGINRKVVMNNEEEKVFRKLLDGTVIMVIGECRLECKELRFHRNVELKPEKN